MSWHENGIVQSDMSYSKTTKFGNFKEYYPNGEQKDEYDFHKTGFNFCWLQHILSNIGYVDISRYPNEPHFVKNVVDNSTVKAFGEYISLNVVARKPI